MSKKFKLFLITIGILIIIWIVPVIPTFSSSGYGIPGCKTIETQSLQSIITPTYIFSVGPKHNKAELKKSFVIFGWGSCLWD